MALNIDWMDRLDERQAPRRCNWPSTFGWYGYGYSYSTVPDSTIQYNTIQYSTVQYSNNGSTVKGRGWIELVELVDLVTTQLGCNLTWLTRFTGFVVGRRTGGGFLGTEDIQRFCSGADQEVISQSVISNK